MRRLVTSVLCGSLTLLLTCASLAAAPARRSEPAPRGAPTGEPRTAEPRAGDSQPREPGAEPGRRVAPRPRKYTLAEPSPEVKLKIKRIRTGANIIMYTGYGLSALGLVSTIAGAVLVGLNRGQGMQTGGTAALIVGAATLAGGAALWAVGRGRMNKADLLLIKAQMRQVQLLDPTRRRPGAPPPALALPKAHTVFSAQLRF